MLSVLATLAFDGRREKLFTQEFVNAMKMLDEGTLNRYQWWVLGLVRWDKLSLCQLRI